MTDQVAAAFHREVLGFTDRMKRELGYNPTLFIRMVSDYGAVGAAKRLFAAPGTSDGFATLWENNRMDWTVEAAAMLPWFADLFSVDDLRHARKRLEAHTFDVDAYVATRSANPPDWWDG